jgi:hypothetical protein
LTRCLKSTRLARVWWLRLLCILQLVFRCGVHDVSYFCRLKHILETKQIGGYEDFVQPGRVSALGLKDDLID